VIPPEFDYVRADSAEAAIAALVEHGEDAKLLAGGHSLIPLLKLRLAQPAVLIDIERVRDLSYIRDEGDHVAVGALTRHRDVERSELLSRSVPLLPAATAHVGDPQVRNRGTIGGSLAHGDGAADLPAVAIAAGATLVLEGPGGRREVAVDDFFQGFLETALGPDELLIEIRFPVASPGWGFQKFRRRAQDWAVVGCAVSRSRGVGSTGVALVNMGSTPFRARAVETALAAGADAREAADLADEGTDPSSDIHASSDYRRHLSRVLVRRALEAAGH
jgi:aerobic carbon-monoxide dehydrogenase medium subunit